MSYASNMHLSERADIGYGLQGPPLVGLGFLGIYIPIVDEINDEITDIATSIRDDVVKASGEIKDGVVDIFTSIEDQVNDVITSIETYPVMGSIFLAIEAPVRAVMFPVTISIAAIRGENVADFAGREWGKVREGMVAGAEFAETFGAFIPVVGPVVGAAGALTAGLADGRPLDEIVVRMATAAIPGGPIVAAGIRAGVAFGKGVLEGQSARDALNDAVRAAIPPGPARSAYDFASAIAKGERLDDAAIDFVVDNLPFNDAIKTLIRSLVKTARDLVTGAPAPKVIIDVVVALPIPTNWRDGITSAMNAIMAAKSAAPQAVGDELKKAGIPAALQRDLAALAPSIAQGHITANQVFKLAHDLVGSGATQGFVDLASVLFSGKVPQDIVVQVQQAMPAEAKAAYAQAHAIANVPNDPAAAREWLRNQLPATTAEESSAVNAAYDSGLIISTASHLQTISRSILDRMMADEPVFIRNLAFQIQFDPAKNNEKPAVLAKDLGTDYEPTRRALYYVLLAGAKAKGVESDPSFMATKLARVSGNNDPEFSFTAFNQYNAAATAHQKKREAYEYSIRPLSVPAKIITSTVVASSAAVASMTIYGWYTRQSFPVVARSTWGKTKQVARLKRWMKR